MVVNQINIAHLERKRQAAEFDVPVDDLPVGRSAKRRNPVPGPSPDAFLESQRKAARIQQEPSVPFDEEPISGNTVIPSAHQGGVWGKERFRKKSSWVYSEADADIAQAVMQAVAPMPEEPALEKSAPKTPGLLRKWWPRRLRKTPRRPSRSITFSHQPTENRPPAARHRRHGGNAGKYPPPERGSAELQN